MTVIMTKYEEAPYFLKGIEFHHQQRTVCWTMDIKKAQKFKRLKDAREFMEREDLWRRVAEISLDKDGKPRIAEVKLG